MDKIEGGGSYSICPKTGDVTAQHEIDKAAAAEKEAQEKAAAEAAKGEAEPKPAKSKIIPKE